jgi:hypothetical protein
VAEPFNGRLPKRSDGLINKYDFIGVLYQIAHKKEGREDPQK